MSDTHLDPNIPGNPAYHFAVQPPRSEAVAGWTRRAEMIAEAHQATRCVHAGVQPDPAFGAVMPPIYQSSTFAFKDIGTNAGYDYTRSGNPTRACLEEAIAILEGGSGATCTSTGMSAITVTLNLLPAGSHLIATVDCYGGTYRLLEHAKTQCGLEITYVDLSNADALTAALRPDTRMVWIETPSNPLLRITDIAQVVEITRGRDCFVVVDNTFLSPVLQQPFVSGADIVVHSTTKYLNGHSDVVGGAVVAGPNRTALLQRLQSINNLLGTSQSPHDCFLVLRGLKTLHLRMQAHEAGAAKLAAFLASRREVERVFYPGLSNHAGHAVAARQQRGFGGMVSFTLAHGSLTRTNHVLRDLRWFTLAESLGGVESLVAHPATMTHAAMTPEARARAGIGDALIRLSVGIENPDDLIADLARALDSLPAC